MGQAMALAKPLADYETVKTWNQGLCQQWGGDPLSEEPEMLEALQEFCEFVAEDPDAIAAKLFRIRKADGERVLSVKWRTHYANKVKEFRLSAGGGNEAQRKGAAVLSFLIHNGVLIQV
jgi:hypothetical protein